MTGRRRGFLFFKLFLLVCVLAVLAWSGARLDWHLIGLQLGAASVPSEIGMAIAWIVALFIRPLRLQILLKALTSDSRRSYWTVWSADIIAMATNSVVPMRAGDMMMAFVLRQRQDDRTASVFSIVMIDRLFDLGVVIIMFVAALSCAPTIAPWASHLRSTLVVALIALTTGVWLAVRMREIVLGWIGRGLAGVSADRAARWEGRARDLFAGLAIVDKPWVAVPVVLLSAALWGATALSYWFGIHAVWPDISFVAAAYAAAAVALSFVVPLTPGGVGVFHAAAVLALSLFGVPAEPALAFAIIVHAFQLGSVLVLALVGLLCQGIGLRTLTALRGSSS